MVYLFPLPFLGAPFFAAFLAAFLGGAFLVAFFAATFCAAFLTSTFLAGLGVAFVTGFFGGAGSSLPAGGAAGGTGAGAGSGTGAATGGVAAGAGVSFTLGSISSSSSSGLYSIVSDSNQDFHVGLLGALHYMPDRLPLGGSSPVLNPGCTQHNQKAAWSARRSVPQGGDAYSVVPDGPDGSGAFELLTLAEPHRIGGSATGTEAQGRTEP